MACKYRKYTIILRIENMKSRYCTLYPALLTGLLLFCISDYANVILMSFKEFPIIENNERIVKLHKKLSQPATAAKQHLKALHNRQLLSGIFGTYAGYLNVSDYYGNMVFPRLHTPPVLNVIITSKMTPIAMLGNTLSHWELEEGTPAAMYRYEQKVDEESKLLYWDVKKVDLPENSIIPSTNSIVIVAKPQDIYIPEGITPTSSSTHLLLPDIYVKKTISKRSTAFYLLNLSHFFGTLYEKARAEKKNMQLLVYP